MNNKILRVGIAGYGKMGKIREKALENDPDVKICQVYDVNSNNLPEHSEFEVAAELNDLLTNPDLDIVYVCLSNHLNKEAVITALQAGKDVFCEKPPAFTAAEVLEIIEVEKKSNRKLMYGFNHRHHGAVIKMKEIVDSGDYGKVLWMRGRYGKSVDEGFFTEWRANKELAGGGILLDQGIHMLDLFLHLGGKFDEVHAIASTLYWNIEGIEDNVFAIFRNNETGMAASLHSTMTQWRHLFSLEVFLERGYMVLNGLNTSSKSYGDEMLTVAKNRSVAPAAVWSDEEKFHFEEDISWDQEAKLFIDAVRNDTPITTGSSQDALEVMKLIDEIYSNETHTSNQLNTQLKSIG